MDNDNVNKRFEQAIQRVRELRKFMDFGLAVTNAASEFEVDRAALAKEISKLATAAKAEKKRKKEEAKQQRLAKWKEADDRRYGWMND